RRRALRTVPRADRGTPLREDVPGRAGVGRPFCPPGRRGTKAVSRCGLRLMLVAGRRVGQNPLGKAMANERRDGLASPRPVRVECYAGYRGEETPRRFCVAGAWREVETVVDRWRDPDHCYFKVQAGDGVTYLLRHDTESHGWELVGYRRDRE